jgi:hypothetical protein
MSAAGGARKGLSVKGNSLIRWSTVAAVVFVASVAGWASYSQILALATHYHETGLVARFYPGTVDGLIYSSSMVLLDAARRAAARPMLALWILVLGIIATLSSNVWDGLRLGGFPSAVVYAWPAVALVFSYEMLMLIIRGQAVAQGDESRSTVEAATAGVAPQAASPAVATPSPQGFAGVKTANGDRPKVKAPKFGTDEVQSVPDPGSLRDPRPERSRHAKGHPTPSAAAREFYQEIGRGELPSLNEIQARLHVGIDKARSYRTHFAQVIDNQQVTV